MDDKNNLKHIRADKPKAIVLSGAIRKDVSDNGERRITFVASSSQEDRHGESVDVQSLKLPLKGGGFIVVGSITESGVENVDIPLMIDHSWSIEDAIGSVRKAWFTGGELIFEAGLIENDKTENLMKLIDGDHLSNNFSISMRDYDYNFDSETIYNAEVVEVSVVFRGANREARLLEAKFLLKGDKMQDDKQSQSNDDAEKIKALEADVASRDANIKELEEAQAETETENQGDETAEDGATQTEQTEEKSTETEAETTDDNKEKEEKVEDDKQIQKSIAAKQVVPVPNPADAGGDGTKDELSKEMLVAKQIQAYVKKDAKTLAELNRKALETYKDKAAVGYLNTGAVADGGAVVPSAQLLTDVFSIIDQYSQIAADLRVITLTEGNSLDIATLLTDVIITEVAEEAGDKAVTRPTFGQEELTLRELAGIAVITKKLARQAAVDIYAILRDSFARAIASKRAKMALTDPTGLVNLAGVVEVPMAGADLTWADIKKLATSIPAIAVQGAKYYLSREALATMDQLEDTTGRDLDVATMSGDGLTGTFKNGFPFAVEDQLTGNQVIFGSANRYGILLRQATVEDEMFDSGTVTDDTVEYNLIQQNLIAERVAFYENVGYPVPGAFARLVAAE
jgi:HK97 family phage major capsid protein